MTRNAMRQQLTTSQTTETETSPSVSGRMFTLASEQTPRSAWPDAVAYREAIQTPHLSLADPTMQSAGIQLDRRGLPVAYAGRFAIVFRLVGEDNEIWALRCFTTPGEGGRGNRYPLIKQYVDAHRNIFVPFRYLERGIKVGKMWYPVLAMRWASGEPLGRWVETHRKDADSLRHLCGTLTDLLMRLETAGIAHGDWQHDNLLIADGGRRVTLVDYDGMYVPELAGQRAVEIGHPNYQHPARTSEHFGVGLDRFGCLVIQTALLALAQEPSLWERYSDGESLLFKREDFQDPGRSPLFQELRAIAELTGDETLADAIARLTDACGAGAMSTLLPAITPDEEASLDSAPVYAPIHPATITWRSDSSQESWLDKYQQRRAVRNSAEAVGLHQETGQTGPWWTLPETVTRQVSRQPAQITTPQPRRQQVTVSPKDAFAFIERTRTVETHKAEERHLLNWRLGGVAMVMAVLFILGVAITLQNWFIPIYFAWLFAYASLGYEKWPRKVVYDELVAEIDKMEKLIARHKQTIAEKSSAISLSGGGATTVGEYVTEKLRRTSINHALLDNRMRMTTIRQLRTMNIETALDFRDSKQIDGIPAYQLTALQNWVRELEMEAQTEYRKTVGVARSAPSEVKSLRHVVGELERHVTLLKRELEQFPDVSLSVYLRKLFGQDGTSAPSSPPSTTP